jgi:dipeptidase D
MDMVSYGPTIRCAHSPDEAVQIATVSSFWELTVELMTKLIVK